MSERMPAEENKTDPTLDMDTGERREPPSLYQQVMEDPEARRIYFELSEKAGMLYGYPSNEDVIAVIEKLGEARIPYLHSTARIPRPMFIIKNRISVGQKAIEAHIVSLSED